MADIKLIDIKESILANNDNQADVVRGMLEKKNTKMINLMASPGAGKTSLILQTIKNLPDKKIGIIEGDIESLVDSKKIQNVGAPVVQIRTGGACHLDAPMITPALEDILEQADLDLVIVENIGNLVCPAEFDIGANLRVMILSVPEGDDKVLKYPLMFSVSDVCIINKMDYMSMSDFDLKAFYENVRRLNPDIKIFEVSSRTGEGIQQWCDYLKEQL